MANSLKVTIITLPFRHFRWGIYHSLPKDFFQPPGDFCICFYFPYSCLLVYLVILTRKEVNQNLMIHSFSFFLLLLWWEKKHILRSLKFLKLFKVASSIKIKKKKKPKPPNHKPKKKPLMVLQILTCQWFECLQLIWKTLPVR